MVGKAVGTVVDVDEDYEDEEVFFPNSANLSSIVSRAASLFFSFSV